MNAIVLSERPTAAGAGATSTAPTLRMDIDGQEIAYRPIGSGAGVPLLLLTPFRGTMDHWDPALIDRIAARRRVILFDQPGFARSPGTPAESLSDFAAVAAQVADALGHAQVAVLGFSMGGTVPLQFALDHPQRLRRLVIAGSGPGHVANAPPDVHPADASVWQVATKPVNDDADFLFLFFEPTASSRAAGQAYLSRLHARADAFEKQVAPPASQVRPLGGHGRQLAAAALGPGAPSGAGGQRPPRHHGADLRLLRDGAGAARRKAGGLSGLGPRLPVPVPGGLRGRGAQVPRMRGRA